MQEPPSVAKQEPSQAHPALLAAPAEPAQAAWHYMPAIGRATWVAELINTVVTKALGKEVAGSQPLMVAGLDSLGMLSP